MEFGLNCTKEVAAQTILEENIDKEKDETEE